MGKLKFLLVLIFVIGFLVRLYKFNAPIADWHAWRQTDTSAVSKFFIKDGFDVFHPRFYDLSNVPSGVWENPQGYRFVEFPIYNIAQAGLFKLFGILTIEEWGRLVTIFSSLASAAFLFLIVKKRANSLTGILAAFFFLFIPFNIYFSRTTLPDESMVATMLGGIYFFDRWLDINSKFKIPASQRGEQNSKLQLKSKIFFILAIVFTASSLLLKPFAIFFVLPMIYLVFEKYGLGFLKKWQFWIFIVLSLFPLALWRIWEFQYPGGIPQSGWLLNGTNIRFKGAFFQWIFAERIGKLILGYWALPLLILGFLVKINKKNYLFFLSFLVSSLAYITVFATGNVQHDYYQILIIPSLSIFLALGSEYLFNLKDSVIKIFPKAVLTVCILFMLFFGWYNIRDFYNIQHPELIRAGKQIDKLTPKNAKIVVPTDGDTTALYFMQRQGWSSFEKPLPQLKKMGADYLVFINPKNEDFRVGKKHKIISYSADYILFDLHQKP